MFNRFESHTRIRGFISFVCKDIDAEHYWLEAHLIEKLKTYLDAVEAKNQTSTGSAKK